jgi:hypothetical protein
MIALIAALALAQGAEAITLTVDKNALGEGQQASFTIKTTDAWNQLYQQHQGLRILGFVSWKAQAIHFDAEPGSPEITPVITPEHVGQDFALCVGVFEYGPNFKSATDAVENSINLQLQDRADAAKDLATYAAQVNAADDQALAALKNARDQVRAIVQAGQPGAEQAADDAMAAGWAAAEAAWAAAQTAIANWKSALGKVQGIEDQIRQTINAGYTYYANMVQGDAKALKEKFLEDETATVKTVHKVRRELLLVRPQGASDRVDVDAIPAGLVSVTKKGIGAGHGAEADFVILELEGQAQVSAALKDIKIRALVNNEEAASMPHTNIEYKNLRLTRQHDVDDSLDYFAYDDAKYVVPDKDLLVFARGVLSPAVSRYAARTFLSDHLRIDIPVVDDSHGAATRVKPLPKRALNNTDKKFATIDFNETLATTTDPSLKIRLAVYNGEGDGAFLTVFAYNGLPHASTDFGKKTLKIIAVSIDGASADLASFDVNYFFTFRKTNHSVVAGDPAQTVGCVNGLWYYSQEGGGGAPAVPAYSWQNAQVGGVGYGILRAFSNPTDANMLGLTSTNPSKSIQLYGQSIAVMSASLGGFSYNWTETATIGKQKVTQTLNCPVKRFSDLVAHVWRHELRHAEQIEKLAKAPGDTVDQDGDGVYNLQEGLNKTDPSKDTTYSKFPVSPASSKGDSELDCELRAVPVLGVAANDWAMETRVEGKGQKAKTVRLGTQWKED